MEPAQTRSVAQFTIALIQNTSTEVLLVVSNATILSPVLGTKGGEGCRHIRNIEPPLPYATD